MFSRFKKAPRAVAIAVLAAFVVAMLGPGAGAAAGPPPVEDDITGWAIDPPGQCGFIDQSTSECAHYSDQLGMYAAFVKDDNITESELGNYFKSFQFGPGANIDSSYSPKDGITVYRDAEFGVPHVYADNVTNATYGLGYVSAEDRLWEMDVLRHAARGTLTEFVGNDADNGYLNMDIDTRREGYTQEEVQKMFDDFDDKFGETGRLVQEGLQAYSDGINQYIDEAKTDPSKLPFEYTATQNTPPLYPEAWSPLDTLFLIVLQLRVFGETAGDELQNAGLYSHVVKQLGKKTGRKVYNDLAFQNDPGSPTSIARKDKNFHTQNLHKTNWKSVAIPDNAEDIAKNTILAERSRERVLASFGFRSPTSNAIVVSREQSATGNPLQIGAPQVGYANPGFFMDIDVHAPGVDFRGPAVPGASALIPLGRGRDYAWSLTTGYSDAVDTRAELLCNADGSDPTLDSTGYMFKGKCKEMESRDETFTIKPTAANPGPPGTETRTFYRTDHGPVFQRALVNGKPVAFVKERFFWKKEVDSVPAFYEWNTQIDDIDDFARAAKNFTMSFNAFYADSENIGYWHVGFYPKRVKGQSPSLPTWGTGKWEWKGRRPFEKQPQIYNPKTGWIANWNNKPAQGWSNYDSAKWGSIQRVQLLQDQLHELLDGSGKATLVDLVNVIRQAATQDARGVYLGPKMLKMAGSAKGDDNYKESLALMTDWVDTGSHRTNIDDNDTMEQGAALAIFDQWYTDLVHGVFDDDIGKDGYDFTMAPITDYTPAHGSSFWFDFSSYLKNIFAGKHMAVDYCDNRETKKTETCQQIAVATLKQAIVDVIKVQGPNPDNWFTPREDIVFQELGYGSVANIPWQNRGTHNHAVEILRDAGPIVQPSPSPSDSGSSSPSPSPSST